LPRLRRLHRRLYGSLHFYVRRDQTALPLPPRIDAGAYQHHHHHQGQRGQRGREAASSDRLPRFDAGHADIGCGRPGLLSKVRYGGWWVDGALHFGGQFVFIQAEQAGVLPDEALGEHDSRQLVELLLLDGLQKPRGNLQFAGDLFQLEIAFFPLATQSLADRAHTSGLPRTSDPYNPIIL